MDHILSREVPNDELMKALKTAEDDKGMKRQGA